MSHKIALIILSLTLTLQASIFDYSSIKDANNAYSDGNYSESSRLFGSVATKNNEARFDYGVSLYREGEYNSSIEQLEKIPLDSKLKDDALYNMGNTYAKMSDLKSAKHSYEEALKIVDDDMLKEKIEHNLEQVNRALKKQEKQKQKSDKEEEEERDKKSEQNDQDKENSAGDQEEQKEQNADKEQNKDGRQDNKDEQQSNNDKESKESKEQSNKESKDDQKNPKDGSDKQDLTQDDLSDALEKRYNKMLDSRGVKTMMIPLKSVEGADYDEQKPW